MATLRFQSDPPSGRDDPDGPLPRNGPAYAAGGHRRVAPRGASHVKTHLTTTKKPVHKKKHAGREKPARRRATAVPSSRRGCLSSAAPTAAPTTPVTSGLLQAGWLTTRDGSRRLDPLTSTELAPSPSRSAVHVTVDDGTRYQRMDGFGAALTESSAHLLMQLSPAARTAALRSLFDPVTGAGIDLVRLPLGASDFALSRYTYDDLPAGADRPGPQPVQRSPTTTPRSCRCCGRRCRSTRRCG